MTDREKFEKHYREIRCDLSKYAFQKEKPDGDYCNLIVQLGWVVWQTAIAASGRDDLLAACKAALDNDEVSEGFGARNMEDDLRQQLRDAIQKAEAS